MSGNVGERRKKEIDCRKSVQKTKQKVAEARKGGNVPHPGVEGQESSPVAAGAHLPRRNDENRNQRQR